MRVLMWQFWFIGKHLRLEHFFKTKFSIYFIIPYEWCLCVWEIVCEKARRIVFQNAVAR